MKKVMIIACAALLGVLLILPGCAAIENMSSECAGYTVVGAGAGGLAGVFVGNTVLEGASKEVRVAAAVGSVLVGAYLANQACARANAQRRELEAQFAAAQAELDSLRSVQGSAPEVVPPPPKVENTIVTNEETDQTEAVMTVVEFGESVLAFETNSHRLPPMAPVYLRPLARAIAQNPDQQIVVVGHTDDIGSSSTNLTLSELRAQSVAAFLAAEGVPQERLQSLGAGEYKPIMPNDTPQHRAMNRRVEVFLIYPV